MYDDLVTNLREAPADWYDSDLHYQAADVIEELSKRVASEIALEECWHRLENRPLPDIPKLPKEEV